MAKKRFGAKSGGGTSHGTDDQTTRYLATVDASRAVLQHATKWGALGWIAYQAGQSILVLAGNTTTVSVIMSFFLNTSTGISITASLVFGVVGVGYGLSERALRQHRTAQLGDRIKELEYQFDPNRSGSRLDSKGRTNPRDAGG